MNWWASLSFSAATAILCALFALICFLALILIAYFEPRKVEIRKIKKRRHQAFLRNQDIMSREICSPGISRAFMKAMQRRGM